MSARTTIFSINEYYHLYSRGVDKRVIFLNDEDRKRFIRLLYLCNNEAPVVYKITQHKNLTDIPRKKKLVSIGAYCLMPNHFHLLVKETEEGGIAKFMSKLLTAYSSYFNKRYERTGTLFGSGFKASHLDSDEYLRYMFAYIHLNPLKLFDPEWKARKIESEPAKKFLESYSFSSHFDYLERDREEKHILDTEAFPSYFIGSKDFKRQMYEWLNFDF
ncbi:MAG: hypothetical protein JWN89_685 [Parcubacteria group bacterium]|nr:hypothetical protein [Parcubacteria group bacterium]